MKSPTGAHPPKLSLVFAAASERGDQWRQLNALARAWAAAGEASASARKAECVQQWDALRGLEQFWAYPGQRLLDVLASALAGQDAEGFARLVQKVSGGHPLRRLPPRRAGLGSRQRG